jgi:VanZ family protein
MVFIFYMSSRDAPEFMKHHIFDFQDKSVHLAGYFVLAVFYLRGLLWSGCPPTSKTFGIAVILTVLYGASDEYHQSFVPTRTAAMDDLVANALGSLCLFPFRRILVKCLEWEQRLWG